MKINKFLFTLLILGLLLFTAQSVFALNNIKSLPNKITTPSLITGIEIKGVLLVPQQDIADVIFSKVGEKLQQDKVNQDLKAIYGLGWFSDATVDFRKFQKGTKIIFNVVENPIIVKINISGNSTISSTEIRSIMETKPGRVLNYKILQSDIKTINNYYHEAGFVIARVTDVNMDEKNHILHVKIVEGAIESIAIEGNDATKDYVILRELKSRPGQVLNEKTLTKDLRKVFNLGYFQEVIPNFEPGTNPDQIALVLKVKESRSSSINFGGGYGEREGWFGFIDLSINNLFGTGRSMLIRGQSGQSLSTYQFKYNEPWFWPEMLGDHQNFTFRRWLTLGTDVYLTQQDEVRDGWDMELGHPLSDNVNGSFVFGSEKVEPYQSASFEGYIADSIGATLSYDTRDFWLNPTEGMLYTLSIKEGWKYSSREVTNFTKLGIDANHYINLKSSQVLAFHLGTGIGFGDVPIGDLFWCGSANTVRGYYPSEARTGTRKFIGNMEYRYTFNEVFQGVVFYDFGDAWNEGFIAPSHFMTGWGPGIRLNTPLGPIRLDYGVPGYANFGQGVIHFSIGQAF